MNVNAETITAILRAFNKARSSSFLEWLRRDQGASYALDGPVTARLSCADMARMLPSGFDFATADGSLAILRDGDSDVVTLEARAFTRESRLWNGPDVISDDGLAAMASSLFHDLVWEHRAEIAAAAGIGEMDVLQFGNVALVKVWRFVDPSFKGRVKSWAAFQAVSGAKRWYHPLKRWLGLATALAVLAHCAGCWSIPAGEVESIDGIEAVQRAMGAPDAR